MLKADDGCKEQVAVERIPWSSLVFDQQQGQGSTIPDANALVGAGAFGVVYRANWLRGKAKKQSVNVAVKVFKVAIKGKLVSYASIEQSLFDEAHMMQRASDGDVNAFVVKLFGVSSGVVTPEWIATLGIHGPTVLVQEGDDDEAAEAAGGGGGGGGGGSKMLALIMKYEAGGTLESLLYNPSLPWTANTQERLRLLLEIATGLWHLHNNSEHIIVHGDIKPENVLLSADMHVRLSDFGLATAREAITRASKMSSVVSSEAKSTSGTWVYQAPEMSRNMKKHIAAQKASRSTDIYALGTLMWEVLAGQKPWCDSDVADRLLDLRQGENLDMSMLKMDTPVAVKEIIVSCLAFAREERPRIDEVRICLEQAHNAMQQGEFDIFLSYAWGRGDCRKPLADQIYLCLGNAGYRVWMDSLEMGLDLNASMTQGITHSKLVVILLSPDYVNSRACNYELREVNRLGKPIVVCVVEPGFWREWKKADGSNTPVIAPDSEVIALAKLTSQLYADCSEAVGVNWADKDALMTEQRRVLTHGAKAMPMLKSLVQQALASKDVDASLSPSPATSFLPPAPPSPLSTAQSASTEATKVQQEEQHVANAAAVAVVAAAVATTTTTAAAAEEDEDEDEYEGVEGEAGGVHVEREATRVAAEAVKEQVVVPPPPPPPPAAAAAAAAAATAAAAAAAAAEEEEEAVNFVRVNSVGGDLYISQLLVYSKADMATNMARGKAVTCSRAAKKEACQNITDGDEGDRSWQQGLYMWGEKSWAQVDLSKSTNVQRVVVVLPHHYCHYPVTYKYTLQLLDASGQHTTFTCDFTKATRSGTDNRTYTFDVDAIAAAGAAVASAAAMSISSSSSSSTSLSTTITATTSSRGEGEGEGGGREGGGGGGGGGAIKSAAPRLRIERLPTPNKDKKDASWSVFSTPIHKQIWDAANNNDLAKLETLCRSWAGNSVISWQNTAVDDQSALMRAATFGHEAAVRLLIAAGANLKAVDRHRKTALHYAAPMGHIAICRILLDEGCMFEAKHKFEKTIHNAANYAQLVDMFKESAAAAVSSVRFVKIHSGNGNLYISQLLVFARGDADTNTAQGKPVLGSSAAANRTEYRNITDGNVDDRFWDESLIVDGVNSWVLVDLSNATSIQRVVVVMPSGNQDYPIHCEYTLLLLDESGQHATYTCDFVKATRSGTNNGTYTFDF